ncbi:MAG: SCPU domain-containing protein [Comamonadaceae bacterium]|nr:MAG: SCPU domain-containing protein [Comamonadaceae bacterium]
MYARPLKAALGALALTAGVSAHALCVLCTGSVSATPHAFGTYSPLSNTAKDSASSVTVTISGTAGLLVSYEIALGTGQAGSVATRAMTNGVTSMRYNLFSDAARSVLWGVAPSATVVDSFLLNVLGTSTRSHDVYGRIPAGQLALQPGTYTDTVTVTVVF